MTNDQFFLCDITGAALKGDMAGMEHPVFSVAHKPEMERRTYENGPWRLSIIPAHAGAATVHDRDVLIYCISQLIRGRKDGREIGKVVRFRMKDCMEATGRSVGGEGYTRFKSALERLKGTIIETTITTGGKRETDGFGLIDRYGFIRSSEDGPIEQVEVTLSDWTMRAIEHQEVLTLSPEYFTLKSPLARRLYEIGRKHCGNKDKWKIRLEQLQLKCGSRADLKYFRRDLKAVIEKDADGSYMPDYSVELGSDDVVTFKTKNTSPGRSLEVLEPIAIPPLNPQTLEYAKTIMPGLDVYAVEQEWRHWIISQQKAVPSNPDAAFIGFCSKKVG